MGSGETCVIGARHEAEISALQQSVQQEREDQQRQWDTIAKIQSRLPVWATVVLSLLTCLLGVLASVVATHRG